MSGIINNVAVANRAIAALQSGSNNIRSGLTPTLNRTNTDVSANITSIVTSSSSANEKLTDAMEIDVENIRTLLAGFNEIDTNIANMLV